MAHLSQHTGDDGAFLVLGGAANFSEAERTQRAAMARRVPDLGANLRYLKPGHRAPPRPRRRALAQAPARPSQGQGLQPRARALARPRARASGTAARARSEDRASARLPRAGAAAAT